MTTSTNGCLVRAPALYGCVDIKGTPLAVPEFLCGCGNGQTSPAFPANPCLTNVTPEVCGGASITSATQVFGVYNNVCGCGDGVFNRTGWVKNVPNTVCGREPSCVTEICEGGAPAGGTARCVSSNNDGIVDRCGT